MNNVVRAYLCCAMVAIPAVVSGQDRVRAGAQKWVATWVGSAHGPYPAGNAVAQPELKFAFPNPADGASDQTFRLIVRPDLWGRQWRIRLSNVFGTRAITFDSVYLGVQATAGNLVTGTNRPVMF